MIIEKIWAECRGSSVQTLSYDCVAIGCDMLLTPSLAPPSAKYLAMIFAVRPAQAAKMIGNIVGVCKGQKDFCVM